jgi:hypothetical protein
MIKITKNGYIHFKDKCVPNSAILTMLSEKMALEEGFTLNSFFKMLNLYPNLVKLETYIPLYLEFYNHTADKSHAETLDVTKKILFNSYIVEDEGVAIDKKHNLTVKFKSGYLSTVNNYQLFDLINNPIILNEKIVKFKLQDNPQYEPLLGYPKKLYVRSPDSHKSKEPCDLFSFIIFLAGSLFKGMTPENRRNHVEITEMSYNILASEVFKEINKIVSGDR